MTQTNSYRRLSLRSIALLCLSVLPVITYSAEERDSVKTKVRLQEVRIEGHHLQTTRAAMPVQLFSENEFSRLNATNVTDVAKHFAGVTVKDYGGIGGLKTVSLRGLGAQHTGVSYDGIMLSDIQSGQIDLSRFSLENISDISLNNGQPNDIFQTARMFASAGVLCLNTKLPEYDGKNELKGHATVRTGSFGLFNPAVYLTMIIGPKLSISASGDFISANGKYDYVEANNQGNIKTRNNSDVTSVRSELNGKYLLHQFESIFVKTNYYYSERGLPGPNILYSDYSTDRMLDRNLLTQIQYENKKSCYVQYKFEGKLNRAESTFSTIDAKYSGDHKVIDKYRQNEYYLSSVVQYHPVTKLIISTAIDWWYNDLQTHTVNLSYKKDASPVRNTLLANIATKYLTEKATIGADLLFTYAQESAETQASPKRKRVSPTISGTFKLIEDTELRIRAFYKNIYRLPTFTELYYHDYGYVNLQPEINNQYNLGIVYSGRNIPFIKELECSIDAYYNNIKDKITVKYGMPFSSVRNLDKVEIKGIDANLKAVFPISSKSTLNLMGNYTFLKAINLTDKGSENYREQIPYTPRNSGAGTISFCHCNQEYGYNIIYSGTRWDGQNIDDNKLKAYTEQSIFTNIKFKKVAVKGEVLNLFNTQYDIVKNYPMPGRNYKITLKASF